MVSMWFIPSQGQISSRPVIRADRMGEGVVDGNIQLDIIDSSFELCVCISDCFADSFMDVMGQ